MVSVKQNALVWVDRFVVLHIDISLPLFTWFVLIFYIFNSLALFYCTILSHDVITPIFLRGNTSFDYLFNRNLIGKSVIPGRNMWSALHVAFLW